MIDLPLNGSEYQAFMAALSSSHRVRIRAAILNHDEKQIGSLTSPGNYVIDGSVDVDASQPISRSLELQLADPRGRLAFDPRSPSQGALFTAYMISVRYGVFVAEADDWVDVPVFTGPLTAYSHQGGMVSVEAQGKEALMLDPYVVTQGYTIQKNTDVDEAIRQVGRKAGESRFDIPRFADRKVRPNDIVVQPGDEPWRLIAGDGGGGLIDPRKRKGKGGRDRRLTDLTGTDPHVPGYNGRGQLTVRRAQARPVARLDRDWLVSWPSISYDLLTFRNWVRVVGGKPKGAKHAVQAVAQLPERHPLSPQSLARSGEPGRIALIEHAANLNRPSEVNERAAQLLRQHSILGTDASFDSLPLPHLEENDVVTVETRGEGPVRFAAKGFTLPLTPEPMTFNTNRKIRLRSRRRNRGRRRGHGRA